MSHGFLEAYGKLKDFVKAHPEIEIGESVTSIPEEVRPGFYGLFNATRDAFVREKFPSHLSRARVLQKEYEKAAEDASRWLSLEDPPTVNPLRRFLNDPKDCLARELFDPLFDLLKGRKTADEIETAVSPGVDELFSAVFRGGYEKWAVLSLLSLLEVGDSLRVDVRSLNPGERTKPAAQAPLDEVPAPQKAIRFFFSQPRNAIFAVPDFLAYSPRLGRFIGIRSEFQEAAYNALNANPGREWNAIDIDLLILLSKGLTLIYISEKAEEIALVADVAKFCRPDMILWCVDTQSMNRHEVASVMERADRRLKPSKGSYIVANDEWAESEEGDLQHQTGKNASGIHSLAVGYSRKKLLPIVEALMDTKNRTIVT
jgi:hypothetical protein